MLFLHGSDEAYGSDRVLVAAVDTALALGATVRVILPDDTADGWLSGVLRERGIGHHKEPLAPARRRYLRLAALPGYARMVLRARCALRAEIVRFDPTIVHVNTSTLLVAGILRIPKAARLVWHVHEMVLSPRPLAWLLRAVPMHRSHDVIAVSDAVGANLRRATFGRARVHRVHNPISPPPSEVEAGGTRSGKVSAFVGRIFLEAARSVAATCEQARFLIAGSPAPGEEWRVSDLALRIQELGLTSKVEVLGMCEDLSSVFQRAAVVVSPSRLPEGFGLAAVEAMRAGCAVIVSDHGSAREIVTHGVTGILVPPDDHKALARAMATLVRDDQLRLRLARDGRRHAIEAFSDRAFRTGLRAAWVGEP